VITRISFASLVSAAAMAAMDFGRPTDKGIKRLGKSTVFLMGTTGRVSS
jgi:hypothetical protein